MENTKDNQKRFFSLYYGQKVMYVGGVGLVEVGKGGWNMGHPDFFLELKSLSSISNEDALRVAELWTTETFYKIRLMKTVKDCFENKMYKMPYTVADYLRSKGYALPYLEASVSDLEKMNWIKLKQ